MTKAAPQTAPRSPMIARVENAQATLDHFNGKPFVWGKADCARLAAYALQRAGYKPSLARFGKYGSELSARKALRAHGMKDTPDWLDTVKGLQRIPPAAALPGDILGLPGDHGWTALTVVLSGGRALGFHADAEGQSCSVVQPDLRHALACWSAAPCRS